MTVLFVCFLGASGVVKAQQTTSLAGPDTYGLETVRNALRNPEWALGWSVLEKQINRMGDRLAIALVKIYTETELVDARNVERYLPLIRAAFVAPHMVPNAADRHPAVTMLLLRRLEAEARDEVERQRVRDVRLYVTTRTATRAVGAGARHN
jgi:hypothetical protein